MTGTSKTKGNRIELCLLNYLYLSIFSNSMSLRIKKTHVHQILPEAVLQIQPQHVTYNSTLDLYSKLNSKDSKLN